MKHVLTGLILFLLFPAVQATPLYDGRYCNYATEQYLLGEAQAISTMPVEITRCRVHSPGTVGVAEIPLISSKGGRYVLFFEVARDTGTGEFLYAHDVDIEEFLKFIDYVETTPAFMRYIKTTTFEENSVLINLENRDFQVRIYQRPPPGESIEFTELDFQKRGDTVFVHSRLHAERMFLEQYDIGNLNVQTPVLYEIPDYFTLGFQELVDAESRKNEEHLTLVFLIVILAVGIPAAIVMYRKF